MNETTQSEAVDQSSTSSSTSTSASASFHPVVMRINERKAGKNVFKKFLTYGLPTLDQVSPTLPAPDSWDATESKEGEQVATIAKPVYEDATLQYIQESLSQRIQGLARSRDGAGQEPCTNWAEVAESGGTGTKYPVQLKAFREAFALWLKEVSDYSEVQAAAIHSYTDTKRLMLQDTDRKNKFAGVVSEFLSALGDEASEFNVVVAAINRAIATEEVSLDW